jgi:hypothetical protein
LTRVGKSAEVRKELVGWLISEFDKGTPPPPEEWEEMKKEALNKFQLTSELT